MPAPTSFFTSGVVDSVDATLIRASNWNAITGYLNRVRGEVISVKDYGAVGDGTTDDTTAIQAALTAATNKVLYFPDGTYRLTSTLVAASGNAQHWHGQHAISTILRWEGSGGPIISFAVDTKPHLSQIRIDNFGTTAVGIQCNSLFFVLDRVYFWYTGNAYSTAMLQSRTDDAVEFWSIRDCYFGSQSNETARGIYIHTGNAINIDHCFFDDLTTGAQIGKTAGVGVDSGLVLGLSVRNCLIQSQAASTSWVGLDLWSVKGAVVSGNYFVPAADVTNSPAKLAIKVRATIGGDIAGNYFSGDGQQNYAIECASASADTVDIHGNIFTRVVLAGAHITAGTNIRCTNNSLQTTPLQAVQTDGTFAPVQLADDAILVRDAANRLALRNGTTAQKLHTYTTFTDASNYRRLTLYGNVSGGHPGVYGEGAGTGANTDMTFGSDRNMILAPGNSYIYFLSPTTLLGFGTTRTQIGSPSDGALQLLDSAFTLGVRFKYDALPTVASGFGTSPSVTAGSTPMAGSVNVGTGGVATSGVINFNGTAFPAAPFVVCMNTTTGAVVRATATTTQLTITAPVAFTASDVICWICVSSK
jgi:pectate lyase-like protein